MTTRPRRRETEEEAYERLHAKFGGRQRRTARRAEPADDAPGDEGVFVLAGKYADTFIDRMFGPGSAAPDDDDEDLDDDEPDEDPEPDRANNRFFRGRAGRG